MAPTSEIDRPELHEEDVSLRSAATEKREESDATETTSFSEDKTLNSFDHHGEGPAAPGNITIYCIVILLKVIFSFLICHYFTYIVAISMLNKRIDCH